MEEGKLREGKGWLHPRVQECCAGTRAGMCQHVPKAGPTTQRCSWAHGEMVGGRIPQTPSPRGFGAHPVLCPTCPTTLSSSNTTAFTPP